MESNNAKFIIDCFALKFDFYGAHESITEEANAKVETNFYLKNSLQWL